MRCSWLANNRTSLARKVTFLIPMQGPMQVCKIVMRVVPLTHNAAQFAPPSGSLSSAHHLLDVLAQPPEALTITCVQKRQSQSDARWLMKIKRHSTKALHCSVSYAQCTHWMPTTNPQTRLAVSHVPKASYSQYIVVSSPHKTSIKLAQKVHTCSRLYPLCCVRFISISPYLYIYTNKAIRNTYPCGAPRCTWTPRSAARQAGRSCSPGEHNGVMLHVKDLIHIFTFLLTFLKQVDSQTSIHKQGEKPDTHTLPFPEV
jgi:hypothetical protein